MNEPKLQRKKRTKRVITAPIRDIKSDFYPLLVERFCGHEIDGRQSPCHLYRNGKDKSSSAQYLFEGVQQGTVHRVAYQLKHGPIEGTDVIRQNCGQRWCCNPDHLVRIPFVKAMKIRDERGNSIRGQRNPHAKLNREQAMEVRRRAKAGESPKALADEFEITPSTVSQIKNGHIWKDR
jgi:hypothetical protein